ncbi:MAG: hypothetical protein ACXWJB_09605 [Limisphaerales bacterium]
MDLICRKSQRVVAGVEGCLAQIVILAENVNRARLSVRWRKSLDKDVGKKAESLTNAFNLLQQILAVNHDSIFLHDA